MQVAAWILVGIYVFMSLGGSDCRHSQYYHRFRPHHTIENNMIGDLEAVTITNRNTGQDNINNYTCIYDCVLFLIR